MLAIKKNKKNDFIMITCRVNFRVLQLNFPTMFCTLEDFEFIAEAVILIALL